MNKKLIRIGRITLAALAALIAFAAVSFVYTSIKRTDAFVAGTEETIRSKIERENVLRGLTRLAEETEASREELLTHVVSVENPASFIEEVERLGRQAGVSIEIGSVDIEDSAANSLNSVSLSVRAEGSWDRVVRFVRATEILPYGVSVSDLSLDGLEREGTWTASLSLAVLASSRI